MFFFYNHVYLPHTTNTQNGTEGEKKVNIFVFSKPYSVDNGMPFSDTNTQYTVCRIPENGRKENNFDDKISKVFGQFYSTPFASCLLSYTHEK